MQELSSRERIARSLKHEPVDKLGLCESFWPDTTKKWREEEKLGEEESPENRFGLDIRQSWCFNMVADLDFEEQTIEEDENTRLVKNGNGSILRWHKEKSGTPEHVDFLVKDMKSWQEHARPHLVDEKNDERRVNFEAYRNNREWCEKQQYYHTWSGVNVFECIHPVSGHEHMLMGMVLEPEWVKDMCEVYAELTIRLLEMLFEKEGKPDGVWFYEDMGFKHKPFMGPDHYKELVWPAHKKTFDFVHSHGLPVLVHSCGFVEALVPGLIEAGMDCLQAMEVKAGMDLLKMKKLYGDKIALMGGLDTRTMVANDREAITKELESKLPGACEGGGYILHSDHSIPDQVEFETYKFFVDKAQEIAGSEKPEA